MGGDGGDASVCSGLFGLEGRRPRRPFKLSVRTTVEQRQTAMKSFSGWNKHKELSLL